MSQSIANPINDLQEIRSLMERSRYFMGLSGLSGVGAGMFALAGCALGLISCFFIGYGLHFWALGFGVLHIAYGIWMYRKYDLK